MMVISEQRQSNQHHMRDPILSKILAPSSLLIIPEMVKPITFV